jgi:DNA-binding transcriptional regulator YhcF (GntR family)
MTIQLPKKLANHFCFHDHHFISNELKGVKTLGWKPNRTEKRPIYKQIADYLEQAISTGIFTTESMLPSERALAEELQVNRSTVVAAYEELQSLGIVERKKGSGTRVSTDIWGLEHKRIPNWSNIWRVVLFFLIFH